MEVRRDLNIGNYNFGSQTNTTPTLTPALRNFDNTYVDSQVREYPNEARFFPPGFPPCPQQGYYEISEEIPWSGDQNQNRSQAFDPGRHTPSPTPPPPRKPSGRKPMKGKNTSPEEEYRRALRREKNKIAAARCRQRRIDRTNELTIETDALEHQQQALRKEIEKLRLEKEQIEYVLDKHECYYSRRRSPEPIVKPKEPAKVIIRPSSLVFQPRQQATDTTTTPSGMNFNFESLLDGGTGLTPVKPLPPTSFAEGYSTKLVNL